MISTRRQLLKGVLFLGIVSLTAFQLFVRDNGSEAARRGVEEKSSKTSTSFGISAGSGQPMEGAAPLEDIIQLRPVEDVRTLLRPPSSHGVRWLVHTVLQDVFEDHHLLTIRSIQRHVQPYVLYLHVPRGGNLLPQSYAGLLFESYPNVDVREYKPSSSVQTIVENNDGGIYFSFYQIVQPSMRLLLESEQCIRDAAFHVVVFDASCPQPASTTRVTSPDPGNSRAGTIVFTEERFKRLEPYAVDALTNLDKHWNALVRRASCDCDQLEPTRAPAPIVPNIVHYFGYSAPWNLTFTQMISVLSHLKINRVSHVYIYGDAVPQGPHWDWLTEHYGERVEFQFFPLLRTVYGLPLNPKWPQHSADVARLIVLERYGGMYSDFDAIVVRPHDELRHYDAVIGPALYPQALENAHMLFRRNSRFAQLFLDKYKQYAYDDYLYSALFAAHQTYQRYPFLLRIDAKLLDIFRGSNVTRLYRDAAEYDTESFYAVHFGHPQPEEFFKFELRFDTVHKMKSAFGSILRHVINYPDELAARPRRRR